jgi:hypothetical protein
MGNPVKSNRQICLASANEEVLRRRAGPKAKIIFERKYYNSKIVETGAEIAL